MQTLCTDWSVCDFARVSSFNMFARTLTHTQAFQDGVVAEQGTHDELLAKNGVYANLVRIQVSASAQEDPAEKERKRREVQAYELQVRILISV